MEFGNTHNTPIGPVNTTKSIARRPAVPAPAAVDPEGRLDADMLPYPVLFADGELPAPHQGPGARAGCRRGAPPGRRVLGRADREVAGRRGAWGSDRPGGGGKPAGGSQPEESAGRACAALADQYARAVDRRDRAAYVGAFHPDGVLEIDRAPQPDVLARRVSGHDELGRVTEAIARYERTFHFVGQSTYDVDGDLGDRRGVLHRPSPRRGRRFRHVHPVRGRVHAPRRPLGHPGTTNSQRMERGTHRMMIELSTNLPTYAADEPASWRPMVETAQMYDRAGFDRLVVSDHVVFGEAAGGVRQAGDRRRPGWQVQPTGPDGHWLEPLTDARVHCRVDHTRSGSARNILHGRPAPAGRPGQERRDARRAVRRPARPRRRRRLAAGGVRGGRAVVRRPGPAPRPHASRSARRCGGSSVPSYDGAGLTLRRHPP